MSRVSVAGRPGQVDQCVVDLSWSPSRRGRAPRSHLLERVGSFSLTTAIVECSSPVSSFPIELTPGVPLGVLLRRAAEP